MAAAAAASSSPAMSEAFLHDAEAALAAFSGIPPGRRRPQLDRATRFRGLAFFLDRQVHRAAKPYWMLTDDEHDDRLGGLALAHPAASELEDLRLHCSLDGGYRYRPRLESLPCATTTLRVLSLTACDLAPPAPTAAPSPTSAARLPLALPRLEVLRLRGCVLSHGYLQAMADAAPALADLALLDVLHKTSRGSSSSMLRFRLRCPALAALELDASGCEPTELDPSAGSHVELDLPSLREFSYKGFPVKLSLAPQPSPAPLAKVYLDVSARPRDDRVKHHHEPIHRMLGTGFSGTRALSLHLHCIEDLLTAAAAGEEEEEDSVLLPTFPNLELLELQWSTYQENTSSSSSSNKELAIARLLGACPAMSELRLSPPSSGGYHGGARAPFSASLERFNTLGAMAYVRGGDSRIGECAEKISELNGYGSTLVGCLRKLTLRFWSQELDCFEVRFAKFVAGNAMALEEMHVADGMQLWTDHLCHNVARWRADSFRRRNLPDNGGFRVYPLPS